MRNKVLKLILFFFFLISISVQGQLGMGQWRVHLAYDNVIDVALTPTKVFAVSEGLFSVDKLTGSKESYDKTKGLNGFLVSKIKYDELNEQLFIVYKNGNIDLLTKKGVVNVPDFYNKMMNVDKAVNDIYIYNNKAYLSCSFGIIIVDLKRKEIIETCYIGTNAEELFVLNTTVHEGYIYALTSKKKEDESEEFKVLRAQVDKSNLSDYENWSDVTDLPLSDTSTYQRVLSFSNQLYVLANSTLFVKRDNHWLRVFPSKKTLSVSISGERLMAFNEGGTIDFTENGLDFDVINTLSYNVYAVEYDLKSDVYWFASGSHGLVSYKKDQDIWDNFTIDGPATRSAWDMTFAGEKLFIVPGGRWGWVYDRRAYVMIFENENWINIDNREIFDITGVWLIDLVSTAVDPSDNTHFFTASYGSGLYEFRDNKFYKHHHSGNSPITTSNTTWTFGYQWLDGTVFDQDGNLWFLNSHSPKSIKVLMKNGTWNELSFEAFNNLVALKKILISNQNQNQKWAFAERDPYSRRLFVFDDNGTIADQSDDKSKVFLSFINNENSSDPIVPEHYHCIAQEKNGTIWLGTNLGPLIFSDPERVFESNYTCSRVKIPRNDDSGLADYLLDKEAVTAIAIDAANRKWLGTKSSGVYLVSENGQETILHFTSENSPLLSDEILSIAINPVSGEVFFGTASGIISFRSDAAESEENFDKAYVYPNPVRENYNGPITIAGLVDNTRVKITDLNGGLVCETISNGGVATWNGKDASGRKVATGVYFALCFNEDGSKKRILKILIIN